MQVRQRSVIAALGAVLVGALAVAGCGSTSTEQAEDTPPAATPEPTSEATAPPEHSPDIPAEADWSVMLDDVALTETGSIYVSTDAGIALLDQATGAWTVVNTDGLPQGTPSDGLPPGRSIPRIAAAPGGALWAAGSAASSADDDGFGVLVDDGWFAPHRALTWVARGVCDGAECMWEVFTSVDTPAIIHADVGDMAIGADGTFFAALGENQLVTYDGTGWESTSVTGLGAVYPWSGSLAIDQQGVLWAGTNAPGAGRGLVAFDGDEITRLTTADGLPSDNVFQVSAAADGTIWVATAAGVAHGEGTTWTTHTPADGLLSNDGVVAAGPDGTAWVVHAEPSGYAYFDGTEWTAYPAAEPVGGFRAVVDADGTLWTLDERSALVRFDGITETVYPSPF